MTTWRWRAAPGLLVASLTWASLCRGQSSHTDAFRSTYSVRYEMHRDDAKSAWKIVGGAVLKDDNKAASSQRQDPSIRVVTEAFVLVHYSMTASRCVHLGNVNKYLHETIGTGIVGDPPRPQTAGEEQRHWLCAIPLD
eukprot:scaffold2418_cov296-Prasinococcus_capsulatus_cf.AAC.8